MPLWSKSDLRPSDRALRQFRLTLLIGFVVVGGVVGLSGDHPDAGLITASLGVLTWSAVAVPGLGRWLYFAWMTLGRSLGAFTQPLVLAVVFVTLFVPLALVFRLLGRDRLRRRFDPDSPSYWETHPGQPETQQFLKPY